MPACNGGKGHPTVHVARRPTLSETGRLPNTAAEVEAGWQCSVLAWGILFNKRGICFCLPPFMVPMDGVCAHTLHDPSRGCRVCMEPQLGRSFRNR